MFHDALFVELEPGIAEAPTGIDRLTRTLKRVGAEDDSVGHEVRRFGEIARGPREPRAEDLGVNLGAPFHAPHPSTRVAHRHAWLRACRVFFDEVKRRNRRALAPARAGGKIALVGGTRIAPDEGARRLQRRFASRSPFHFRA
jgi:hypothetical protein